LWQAYLALVHAAALFGAFLALSNPSHHVGSVRHANSMPTVELLMLPRLAAAACAHLLPHLDRLDHCGLAPLVGAQVIRCHEADAISLDARHLHFQSRLHLRVRMCFWMHPPMATRQRGCQDISNSILFVFSWAQDHRLHHRHTDTDKDPHNAERGFFYSHIGWLLLEEPQSVTEARKRVNVKDLEHSTLVMFQHHHYLKLALPACFLLPAMLGLLWNDGWGAFWIAGFLRYVLSLHATWLVNSAAHAWGTRPYLPFILSSQNWLVSIFAVGEGWHNYHHAYPFDYSASEFGFKHINLTTGILDVAARIGWVSNRRRAPIHKKQVAMELSSALAEPKWAHFAVHDATMSVAEFDTRCAGGEQLLIIDGFVYDIAPFRDCHPGGERILDLYRGKDASKAFGSINGESLGHSNVAVSMLEMYRMAKMGT
jgi:cytochrome b involved in lipid metabolism